MKSRGRFFQPLHDISFSLSQGDVLAVVGESGCGKTTLLRSLTKLFPNHLEVSWKGRVMFERVNLLALPEADLLGIRNKYIRYIIQEPGSALNPSMKIRSQFELLYTLNEERTFSENHFLESAREILADIGIKDTHHVLTAYPHHLSVGMLQRIIIAMALIGNPKLILADEPTSAVDSILRHQILSLLLEYCQIHNLTLILTTHDLQLAQRYAKKIIIMYCGTIVERTTNNLFFRRPLHPYSKMLLASRITLDTDFLSSIPVVEGKISASLETQACRFSPRCSIAHEDCCIREPALETVDVESAVRCPYWK